MKKHKICVKCGKKMEKPYTKLTIENKYKHVTEKSQIYLCNHCGYGIADYIEKNKAEIN